MPEGKPPRKGTYAHVCYEWNRFRHLSREHHGLTSPKWASEILGVSTQRVYQLMDSGLLPNETVLGKRWLFCDALEAFRDVERDCGTRYQRAMGLAAA